MSDNFIILSIISAIFIIILTNLISSELIINLNKKLNNKYVLIILLLLIFISMYEINIALIILITFIIFYCIIKLRISQMQSSTTNYMKPHKPSHPHKNISQNNNVLSFSNNIKLPSKDFTLNLNHNIPDLNHNILDSNYNIEDSNYSIEDSNYNIENFNIPLSDHIIPDNNYNTSTHQPEYNTSTHQPEYNTSIHQPEYNTLPHQPEYNTLPHQPEYNTSTQSHDYKQIIDKREIYENIKLKTLHILKNFPDTDINIIINTFKEIYPDSETIITNAVNESYYSYNSSDNNEYEIVEHNNESNISNTYDIKKLANDYYSQPSNYKKYVAKKSIKDILTEYGIHNPIDYDNATNIYDNINNLNQEDSIIYSNNLKINESNICNELNLLQGYDKTDNFELQV